MRAAFVAALLAAVLVAGVRWGTFAAGGSDSYCYLHQAERWASGQLHAVEPLALDAPWPNAALTFAPAGHRPSPTVPGALAPICSPGVSILMAPLLLIGGPTAAFLLIPVFGVLLIAATYAIGSRYKPRVGVASAVIVATTPAFLYQLVQPMSDVPAAALWAAAVVGVTGTRARSAVWGGVAAAVAIVIRPNLVPLAVPLALFLLFRPERSWPERWQAAAKFSAALAAGSVAVLVINNSYYGSPLATGYGAAETLFSAANVAPNATRYVTWLSETLTPGWVVAAAAPFLLPGAFTRTLLWMFLLNVAIYLPYITFTDWSYLRFLLPAIPLVVILGVAVIDSVCRRTWSWTSRPILFLVALVMAMHGVNQAEARSVFALKQLESRYEQGGRYVAEHLPPHAIVITSWQSGSVRFYSGRRTLLWDSLDPAWLERALAFARERGLEPYLLFETWEEPLFRARFGQHAVGMLDWPPMAEVAGRVRLYRPGDRARYFAGEAVPTDYVR